MKFWDSSALLPLAVEEARSKWCRSLRRADPDIVVWVLTRVELVSALHRLVRQGSLTRIDVTTAQRRISQYARSWTAVEGISQVAERAERLLAVHPLAAADALQLGAALVACKEQPRGKGFVTADARLATAAAAEGFAALAPRE